MILENGCQVCNRKEGFKLKWRAKRHHPTYYSCKNCGLIFAYPQKDRDFQDLIFSPLSETEHRARIRNFELRYERIEKHLSNKLPRVLDIGCLDCIFLDYMKNKGCKVLGIEPSSKHVGYYAKATSGLDVINGFFEDQNIEQKSDLITMFNVLEHTKNPREVLIKSHSLLDENGILVLELPYIFTPQSFLSFGYWHHFEADHNWFFGKRSISCLLKDVGFEVVSISFVPKIARLSKMLDALLARTIYMHVKRDTYLRFRRGSFYQFLNKFEVRPNIMDYLLVIARK